MISFEIEGLDEFQEELENLKEKIEELKGEHKVPFTELFNPAFMRKYTAFSSIEEFFQESEWVVESQKDLEDIEDEELDEYVREKTEFNSWGNMRSAASKAWIHKKLE